MDEVVVYVIRQPIDCVQDEENTFVHVSESELQSL